MAFFGAVDSRPYLFYMTISLLSAQRFHPAAGFFALVPTGKSAEWGSYARRLSDGQVQLMDLPPEASDNFAAPNGGASYSRFTFHRHAMPQLLVRRGFAYSINLDPDVLCTRPWDLSLLPQVQLIAGRRVGTTRRTLEWLQAMVSGTCAETAEPPDGRCSEEAVAARRRTAKRLLTGGSLGVTPASLGQTPEFNGGVLVFNNLRAVREDWLSRCLALYGHVRDVVEGDQDLLSLVLAANLTLPRTELPTVYNYAFRRDRERLPHSIGKQLRHGLFVRIAVNVHFVQDGKPWQLQNMTVYPIWLLGARAHHVHEWMRLAKRHSAALFDVGWTQQEREAFGPTAALLQSTSRPVLGGVLDAEALRLCRCFLRGGDRRADPLLLLQQAAAAEARGGGGEPAGAGASPPADRKSEWDLYRDVLIRERAALLEACSDGTPPSEQEQALCNREWNVQTGSAEASTAARLAIRLGGASAPGEMGEPARGTVGVGKGEEPQRVGSSDARASKARAVRPALVEVEMGNHLAARAEAGRPHGRRAGNATRAARRQAHVQTRELGSHPHTRAHAHPRRAKRVRDGDVQNSRVH